MFLVLLGQSLTKKLYCLKSFWVILEHILGVLLRARRILDDTLMFVRLKNFTTVIALYLGLFSVLFSLGEGAHFQYFSLLLEKGLMCFHKILQRYSRYYSGNHTKNNMACHIHFARYFKVFRGHFCPVYSSPFSLS